jgi:D-arabinose 1-dehydrogenase-like Zn-dependent alcohol dehydrogenase
VIQGFQTLAKVRIASFQAKHAAEIGCPMTKVFPLERAADAHELMMSGKARFRAVLTTGH